MNQKQFTKLLAGKTKLSINEARKLVEAFGNSIENALIDGQKVTYSNFGTFYLVNYPSKVIQHPLFGGKKKMIMLSTNAVKWMPSDNIKDLVGHHLEAESATSFGSTKIIKTAKRNAGISERKAIEVSETEKPALEKIMEDTPEQKDDIAVEVPIRVSKSTWVDRPIIHVPVSEKEIIPFEKNTSEVNYFDLSNSQIPDHILCLVPEEIARRTKVIPIDLKDEILILGMADPRDHDTLSTIRKIVRKKISPRLVSESDFDKIFSQYKRLALAGHQKTLGLQSDEGRINLDNSAPASRIVNLILKRAIRDQATTIHFDPIDQTISVRFRIDGKLFEKTTMKKSLEKLIISRLKSFVKMSNSGSADLQGFFSVKIDGVDENFELLSITTIDGEKITVHIKDRLKKLEKLTELDLRDSDFNKIIGSTGETGLTLVASTSEKERQRVFYALADHLLSKNLNIVTLENNPALAVAGINQINIANENKIDYDSVLTSVSKIDCDVVMIDLLPTGEITGNILSLFVNKTIITGIDAEDSFKALTQLISLGVDPKNLADRLDMVIATRSVKKICPSCKTLIKPESKTLHKIKEILSGLSSEERSRLRKLGNNFYEGKGCQECNKTGFLEKTSLYETLVMNNKIRDLIAKNSTSETIKKEATRDGFTSLDQDGIIKALLGKTSIDEVLEI